MKNKLISPDFYPNFERDDYFLIKKLLKNRKNWIEGPELELLKFEFKKFFPDSEIFLFSTERGALEFFLKFYLSGKKEKKVAIQAFTCFVVPKAIINAGGIPLFLDIKEGYVNFTIDELYKAYQNNPDISVVIIQNTFGIPNDIESIINFCKEKNILLIENLAHSFNAKYQGKFLGNFGEVSLISLGRSKVISGIFGGVLVIRNKELAENFVSYYENLENITDKKWLFKVLLYSYLMRYIRVNYNLYGKFLGYTLRKFNLAVLDITEKEKRGFNESYTVKKMPNVFATIALNQIKKIVRFSEHREKITKIYLKEGLLPYGENPINYEFYYLRFPITSNQPKKLIEKLKKYNIYLGNWYHSPLAPLEKRLDRFGYYYGMCPNAEKLSLIILNLPTNILTTPEDAHLVAELIKKNI